MPILRFLIRTGNGCLTKTPARVSLSIALFTAGLSKARPWPQSWGERKRGLNKPNSRASNYRTSNQRKYEKNRNRVDRWLGASASRRGRSQLDDGPAQGAGQSQNRKQVGPDGLHRLRLVWLVHQTPQGSLFQTGVQRVRQKEPRAPGSRLPSKQRAKRRVEKSQPGLAGKIQNRGLSHHHCAKRRG